MKKIMFIIKIIIKIIIIILVVCGIIIYIFLRSLFGPYSSQKKIEKEFYKNYETILEITSYLEKADFAYINIQGTDYIYDDGNYGTWYVESGNADDTANDGRKEIGDDKFIKEISHLFKDKKYQVISKSRNAISFQLMSTLDMGAGIVYTIDGMQPSIQFLTKLEKLNVADWYYYEADYNEWRRMNENKKVCKSRHVVCNQIGDE